MSLSKGEAPGERREPRRRGQRAPVPADVLFSRIAKANAAVHAAMAVIAFAGFALAGAAGPGCAVAFGIALAGLSAFATSAACARFGGGAAVMAGAYAAKIVVLGAVFAAVAQVGRIGSGEASFLPLVFVGMGLIAGVLASLIVDAALVVRTPVMMDLPGMPREER